MKGEVLPVTKVQNYPSLAQGSNSDVLARTPPIFVRAWRVMCLISFHVYGQSILDDTQQDICAEDEKFNE